MIGLSRIQNIFRQHAAAAGAAAAAKVTITAKAVVKMVAVAADTAPVSMLNPSGLGLLIPTSIFALMLNSCVPSVVQGLEKKDDIRHISRATPLISAVLYISIVTSVVLYFGTSVKESCNVMWENFSVPPSADQGVMHVIAKILGYSIVLFNFPRGCCTKLGVPFAREVDGQRPRPTGDTCS